MKHTQSGGPANRANSGSPLIPTKPQTQSSPPSGFYSPFSGLTKPPTDAIPSTPSTPSTPSPQPFTQQPSTTPSTPNNGSATLGQCGANFCMGDKPILIGESGQLIYWDPNTSRYQPVPAPIRESVLSSYCRWNQRVNSGELSPNGRFPVVRRALQHFRRRCG